MSRKKKRIKQIDEKMMSEIAKKIVPILVGCFLMDLIESGNEVEIKVGGKKIDPFIAVRDEEKL